MTYELAKELKDAGFHQDGFPSGTARSNTWLLPEMRLGDHQESAYAPTLEELIEACTEGQYNFELGSGVVVGEESFVWTARTLRQKGIGYTPTDAVARLWLALNKPPQTS